MKHPNPVRLIMKQMTDKELKDVIGEIEIRPPKFNPEQ
jgi:hypothetical protein